MNSFFLSLIQLLIGGNLSGSIGTNVAALLAENPQTSLASVTTAINGKIAQILAELESKLPGSSQALLGLALALGQSAFDTWVDGLVEQAYNKEIKQLAGTGTGTAIDATADAGESAVLAGEAPGATEQVYADPNLNPGNV